MRKKLNTIALTPLLACHAAHVDSAAEETGQSHDTAPPGFQLHGTVSLPEDTTRDAALTAAAMAVTFGDGPVFGGALASAPVAEDGSFLLDLPAEAPAVDRSAPVPESPTLEAALYAVVVFEDADGDGAWDDGETMAGLAMDRWLSWTGGDAAWPDGWRTADLGMAGQYEPNRCLLDSSVPLTWAADRGFPVFYDLEVTVPLRGLPATLELAGSVLALPEGATGLVGLPFTDFGLGLGSVFDVPLGADFSASLVDAPPAEDDYGSDPDWRYTVHFALAYADATADGWDAGDSLDGTSTCLDGSLVYARYTRPVDSWRGYRLLDCYGGNVGWRAVRTDPDSGAPVFLTSAEARTLVLDSESCRLEF